VICPECGRDIPEHLVRSHVARIMGKKGGKIGGKVSSEAKTRANKIKMVNYWKKKRQEEK